MDAVPLLRGVAAAGAIVLTTWRLALMWERRARIKAAFKVHSVVVNDVVQSEHVSLQITNFGADSVHLRGFYLVDYANIVARWLRVGARTKRMPQHLSDEQTDAGGTTHCVPFELQRGVPRDVYLGQDGESIAFSRRRDVLCVLERADRKILRARYVEPRGG